MKTIVYGSWHLAEVYAVGFCRLGHSVALVSGEDAFENYIRGEPPVFEPEIAKHIKNYTGKRKLTVHKSIHDIGAKAEACFFAEDCAVTAYGVDMPDVERKFREVARSGKCKTIVVSSQIPLGTCRKWQKKFSNIKIVYFPEFLRFGDALKRFLEPDSIVLGGDEDAAKKVAVFFKDIRCPKFFVSLEEAEMAKHAANIFVATTVSFISELTKFSRHFHIDMTRVGEILRADRRVGTEAYTMPGLGFSGTVERDFKVLMKEGKKLGIRLSMLEKVIAVNDEHNRFIENEIKRRFVSLRGKKIGFLGATYKSFTSNMRGSLVAPMVRKIEKEGGVVAVYDPFVARGACTVSSMDKVFQDTDAVVIAVGKQDFQNTHYPPLLARMRRRIIIDAANMLPKDFGKKMKVDYSSIGRGQ